MVLPSQVDLEKRRKNYQQRLHKRNIWLAEAREAYRQGNYDKAKYWAELVKKGTFSKGNMPIGPIFTHKQTEDIHRQHRQAENLLAAIKSAKTGKKPQIQFTSIPRQEQLKSKVHKELDKLSKFQKDLKKRLKEGVDTERTGRTREEIQKDLNSLQKREKLLKEWLKNPPEIISEQPSTIADHFEPHSIIKFLKNYWLYLTVGGAGFFYSGI